VRRRADAAPRVAAEAERRGARGQGGRLASAAAGWGAVAIVRVAGRSIDRIVGHDAAAAGRTVGLAEQDRPGPTHAGDDDRITFGDVRRALHQTRGGDDAGDVEDVLDRERDAVERPAALAPRQRGIGRIRLRAGALVDALHDGVDRGVDLVDPLQIGGDDLGRRDPPGSDRSPQ
jgi:hypothetical protein